MSSLAILKKYDPCKKQEQCYEVAGVLRSAEIPSSKEEWTAIQSLTKDQSIKVLQDDKG